MEEKLDLYPYVAAAIAINPKSWHIVDNYLLPHMDILFEYGIKSNYWDRPPVVSLPALAVVYARKLLSAFEYLKVTEEETEVLNDIYKMLSEIFKKVFSDIYQRVMSEQKVSLKKVMGSLFEKDRELFSWEELVHAEKNMFLTVFCAKLYGKEIVIDEGYDFFSKYLKMRLDYDMKQETEDYFGPLGIFRKVNFETVEQFKKEGRRLQKQVETTNPYFYKMSFLGREVEHVTQNEKSNLSYLQKLGTVSIQEITNAEYPVLNSVLSYIYVLFDVDVPELQYVNLDYREVELIYAFAHMCLQMYPKLPEEEKLKKVQDIVVIAIYLWPLLKDYVKLKQQYTTLHNDYVKKFVLQKRETEDIELLKNEIERLKLIEKRYNELKQQYSDYDSTKKQLDRYKTLYEKLLAENEQLKKENNLIKQEMEKYRTDMEELAKLRSVVFGEEVELPAPVEKDFTILKDKKIAVVGGYKGQFDELKNYVKDFLHIEVGRLNYDENVFANMDVVVFVSKILNHTGYYKAINAVKRLGLKYIITSYTNPEKLLLVLADSFKEGV